MNALVEQALRQADEIGSLKMIIFDLIQKYAEKGEYTGDRLQSEYQPQAMRNAMEALKDIKL